MLSHSKILFLVPLLFVTSIPTYFLNFYFFNHSSNYSYVYQCSVNCHVTGEDSVDQGHIRYPVDLWQ